MSTLLADTNNLSKIENGKKFMSADKLVKIAQALDVDIKELFDFGHITSDVELKKQINAQLDTFNSNQLKCIYKMIKTIKELI